MTWSGRRKTYIILGLVVLFAIPFFTWIFLLIYKEPGCFDNLQNGGETGVDCGGVCQKICTQNAQSPEVVWFQTFPESKETVTGVALLENKNREAEARNLPYTFSIFNKGIELDTKEGTVFLAPEKRTPVIVKGLNFGVSEIDHVSFQLGEPEGWFKVDTEERMIEISNERVENTRGNVKIFATITNNSFTETYKEIPFVVLAYNQEGNVIGYSTTFLESITPQAREEIFLTWRQDTNERITRIEIIPLTEE